MLVALSVPSPLLEEFGQAHCRTSGADAYLRLLDVQLTGQAHAMLVLSPVAPTVPLISAAARGVDTGRRSSFPPSCLVETPRTIALTA